MAAERHPKTVIRWAVAGLLLIAIGALAAVGKPPARKYPNRVPVHFWHRWGGEWEKVVAGIADRFNESQSTYEVIPLSTPSGGADMKFMMGVIGGDPPDVMSMWNGAIPQMAANNLLTPLEDLMSTEDRRFFEQESYPVIRQSGMFRGKTYGVTIGSDLYALYVNVDHLKEIGVDVDKDFPTTLEGLCQLGTKLHRFDQQRNLVRLGYDLGYFQYLAYGFGGGFWDDEAGKLLLDTPRNLRALEAIVRERKKIGHDVVTRFTSGLNTGSDTGGWPFITGDLSITLDGQWRVEEIRKYKPKMNYRVIPMPPPAEGGTPMYGTLSGNFMIVPISAKHKDGAWQFIRFWSGFSDREASAACFNAGGWLPLSHRAVETETFGKWLRENPQFQAFLDIVASPNCKPMPPVPYLQFLNDKIGRAEDRAARGYVTPKVALQELQRTVADELAKRKEMGYED